MKHKKSYQTNQAAHPKTSSSNDPVINEFTTKIITPLNKQANRRSSFSRVTPIQSNSYHLTEKLDNTVDGERKFTVYSKHTSLRGSKEKMSSNYFEK